ncbi:MAG TPA: helix-turn-helix domain-containing protein [Anaerolineae bacterium]
METLLKTETDLELARRAKIVLLSLQRQRIHEISTLVDLHPINVRKWIHRFNRSGIDGLYPRRSPGRPRLFDPDQRQAIIEMATADPQDLGLEFAGWSLQRLRSQLIFRGVVREISAETIRQELLKAGLAFEGRRWIQAD